MPGRGFARAGPRNQRLDPHHPHQPLHPLAVDPTAFLVEFEGHSPRAVERKFEMQLVDVAHHRQIVRPGDGLGTAAPRARHAHKLALVRAPTGPCQTVRPSLFDWARSSTWPPGQEIPFDRQLADLGVKLGRLAFALFLAIARTARPGVLQARDIVENLLFPGINLVRVHPVPLRQFREPSHPRAAPQVSMSTETGPQICTE